MFAKFNFHLRARFSLNAWWHANEERTTGGWYGWLRDNVLQGIYRTELCCAPHCLSCTMRPEILEMWMAFEIHFCLYNLRLTSFNRISWVRAREGKRRVGEGVKQRLASVIFIFSDFRPLLINFDLHTGILMYHTYHLNEPNSARSTWLDSAVCVTQSVISIRLKIENKFRNIRRYLFS